MARNDKPPARTSASITLPSTPASALDREGSPLYNKRVGSPLSRSGTGVSSGGMAKGGSMTKPSYMNTHAEQRVALGASYRKINGINASNHLSATTAKRALHESETVGETRWVRKKSRGQIKLARDKLLSKSTTDLHEIKTQAKARGADTRYEEWN